MPGLDDQKSGNQVTLKFTPATGTTLARTIAFGSDVPADATAFHLTGYGIHFAAGSVNTGEMKVTQANTSTAPQPGSVYMGPGGGSPRHESFGEDGVRLAASDGNITLTYTHGASVALGGWATGFWVR
mgnify:CR=1 FL=1